MLFGKSKNESVALSTHPFSELPILIVSGMGRSGTTVLRNAVALHPEINTLNREANYIQGVLRQAHLDIEKPFLKKALPVNEDAFWRMHQQLILHLHWPIDSADACAQQKALSTYSSLDPRGALGLARAFPQTSVCHIIRNGIEVVSSYRNFKNFSHLSFEEVCQTWAFQEHMFGYVESHPQQCSLVRYEWLNEDLGQFKLALRESLARLNLPWSEKCFTALKREFHPTQAPGETSAQTRDRGLRSERWKTWTPQERDYFKSCCGDLMNACRYEIPW